MFYLNTIEHLFLFVEQLDQSEVCLPYSRLLTGITILAVFQNLSWNSNKTTLFSLDKLCRCRINWFKELYFNHLIDKNIFNFDSSVGLIVKLSIKSIWKDTKLSWWNIHRGSDWCFLRLLQSDTIFMFIRNSMFSQTQEYTCPPKLQEET